MFDIGWSEILVIAVVAIVVVGPKELPKMLRTFGRTMGTVRRTANDFKRQFDEALREAERQADLGEVKSTIQSVSRMDPMADLKKEVAAPAKASQPPAAPATGLRPAEPIKTGAAEQPSSDAA